MVADLALRIAALTGIPARAVRARLSAGDPASLRSLGLSRPPGPGDIARAEQDFTRAR